MEFFRTLKSRVSCRAFTSEPVAREEIEVLLAAGCDAPSPLNQQPWSFTVLADPSKIAAFADLSRATRDRLAAETGKAWIAKYDVEFLRRAAAVVVVAADPAKIGLGALLGEKDAHVKAASACIQNILLAAADRGLGALWYTMIDKAPLRALLAMDEGQDLVGTIPLGVPAEPPKGVPRLPAGERTRWL